MYKRIQEELRPSMGYVKTCWIADVKERLGFPMRKAWNRRGEVRIEPCPPDKRAAIIAAMERLGYRH